MDCQIISSFDGFKLSLGHIAKKENLNWDYKFKRKLLQASEEPEYEVLFPPQC